MVKTGELAADDFSDNHSQDGAGFRISTAKFRSKTDTPHQKCKTHSSRDSTQGCLASSSGSGDGDQSAQPEIHGDVISGDRQPIVNDEELQDFSWLTRDLCFCDELGGFADDHRSEPERDKEEFLDSLSQTAAPLQVIHEHEKPKDPLHERFLIEEEIKRKYKELDELLEQINDAKRLRRRRRKYQLRKHDKNGDGSDDCGPSYVNIQPIKRRKRSAQPIRNAVLMRSAMKNACKGLLGSCCGKGCWAKWRWVNMGHVISDYE